MSMNAVTISTASLPNGVPFSGADDFGDAGTELRRAKCELVIKRHPGAGTNGPDVGVSSGGVGYSSVFPSAAGGTARPTTPARATIVSR